MLGCAVGIIGAAYRIYSRRITSWSVFVFGLVILGAALYDGTGDRTRLESAVSFGAFERSISGPVGRTTAGGYSPGGWRSSKRER